MQAWSVLPPRCHRLGGLSQTCFFWGGCLYALTVSRHGLPHPGYLASGLSRLHAAYVHRPSGEDWRESATCPAAVLCPVRDSGPACCSRSECCRAHSLCGGAGGSSKRGGGPTLSARHTSGVRVVSAARGRTETGRKWWRRHSCGGGPQTLPLPWESWPPTPTGHRGQGS